MKDRVSLYPGRVLITPEDGSAPYHATLTRADEPTQEGTPLNKANLLTDATAALYGKTSTATPNTIFAAIRPLITAAQTSADGKAKIEVGTYTGTGTYGEENKNELTFSTLPKFGIIFLAGYTMRMSVDGLYASVILSAGQSSGSRVINVSVSGNTISWYSNDSALYQMNNPVSYYYIFWG